MSGTLRFAIVPASELMPRLLVTLLKAREDPDHKIIVFFVAARVVQVWSKSNLFSIFSKASRVSIVSCVILSRCVSAGSMIDICSKVCVRGRVWKVPWTTVGVNLNIRC